MFDKGRKQFSKLLKKNVSPKVLRCKYMFHHCLKNINYCTINEYIDIYINQIGKYYNR